MPPISDLSAASFRGKKPPWYRAAIYRLYGADNEVLYVGCSTQPETRIKKHLSKPWGSEIERYELVRYWAPWRAFAMELVAIRALNPKYNIAGRLSHPRPSVEKV